MSNRTLRLLILFFATVSLVSSAASFFQAREAHAIVTTTTRSVTYTGSGGTSFAVPFPWIDDSDLIVTRILIADSSETTFVLDTDYTVAKSGTSGGTLTTTSALTSSYQLRITRTLPIKQPTRFASQRRFRPAAHEQEFDRCIMIAQQISDGVAISSESQDLIAAHIGSADDHTMYLKLTGRSGGQTAQGGTGSGENLTLESTAHATKGKILFGSSAYDEVNDRLGVGTTTPTVEMDVAGDANVSDDVEIGGGLCVGYDCTPADDQVKIFDDDFVLAGGSTNLIYFDAGDGANLQFNKSLDRFRLESNTRTLFESTSADMEFNPSTSYDFQTGGSTRLSITSALTFSSSTIFWAAGTGFFAGELYLESFDDSDTEDSLLIRKEEDEGLAVFTAMDDGVTVNETNLQSHPSVVLAHNSGTGSSSDDFPPGTIVMHAANGIRAHGALASRRPVTVGSSGIDMSLCDETIITTDTAIVELLHPATDGCTVTVSNANGSTTTTTIVLNGASSASFAGMCNTSASQEPIVGDPVNGPGSSPSGADYDSISLIYSSTQDVWFVQGCTGHWED